MSPKKKTEILLYIALIIAILAPRLPALDSFATLDEPYWLSMGANFYYALGQREFQNTIYEYQPAVTTMWIVTAAMLAYFPEYRGLGQGYLEFEKGALDPFMLERGKDPLMLLRDARFIQILIILGLFLLLYYLLQTLIPKPIAFFVILFASFDPFFLGQSRLLDHEAMLSLFVVISVLAIFIYLSQGRGLIFLLLSGISAGLAQLTKSSSIAILMPVGIILLVQVIQQRQNGLLKTLWSHTKIFGLWLLMLACTYFIFWPGMWVAPAKMLHEVYGNAFSYAFQGARLIAVQNPQASQFSFTASLAGIWDLITVLLWRTTLLTWLGIFFGFALPFSRNRELVHINRQLFTLLLSTAAAFILIFGIAQGRNSPHYILTSYLALNLLSALGWFHVVKWLIDRFGSLHKELIQYVSMSLLVIAQLWSAVLYFPYYFTYRNPILYALGVNQQFPQFAYGEGLELAAQYLASLPNAKDSTVISFYSRGSFSYFYPGETTRFKPYYVEAAHKEDLVNSIRSANYLVVYYASQGALEKYQPFLTTLTLAKSLHEIWLNGYQYAIIYQVDTLPPEVFEAFAK